MCNKACIDFGITNLSKEDVNGKDVIEVGSLDLNGSLRSIVERLKPQQYTGVDILKGTGVDLICGAEALLEFFGYEKFDIVISTELIEHVRDWQKLIGNFKKLLKPDGVLLITTRSKGYGYHGYPFDYWRYELTDMRIIFSDFIIEAIDKDPLVPGVFIKVRKPVVFIENDISKYQLYSIINNKRCVEVGNFEILFFKVTYVLHDILSKILPIPVKAIIKRIIHKIKRRQVEVE